MLKNIHILDNRKGRCDLEIDELGCGKWYVWNEVSDKIVAAYTKAEARYIRKHYDTFDLI